MIHPMRRIAARLGAVLLAAFITGAAAAQTTTVHRPVAPHVIVPQSGAFRIDPGVRDVEIRAVRARVRILEQTAATTLQIELGNPGPRRAEAIVLLPLPADAVVSGFLFEGPSPEPTARVLTLEEARREYDAIVARVRDPALLEFAGYNLVRSSVFPVEPNSTQKVRLTYETLLERDGRRIDYVLPRSESLRVNVPWEISVDIESRGPISTVYSPSHELAEHRLAPNRIRARVDEPSGLEPGPFLLSYLLEGGGVTASLFAYPDPAVGGGYFLLMAGLPAPSTVEQPTVPREVTLVLDRSGSMAGEKLEQVRRAAIAIVERLAPGDRFNVIDYATAVSSFAPAAVPKDARSLAEVRQYLARLRPGGGTNLHDALLTALRQPAARGCLPIVLFLTDGVPTVRSTSETRIREMVEQANVHDRRIFTLGVGTDVNAPLLDRIAEQSRGWSEFVLPGEDLTAKLTRILRRLSSPIFADLRIRTLDAWGNPTTRLVREMIPDVLPDLFEGDSLILLGQYDRAGPVRFELAGSFRGQPRSFRFDFDFDAATTDNAFVARLWASRRVAFLVDQVRQIDEAALAAGAGGRAAIDDPRVRELTEEILRLSTEFGVLTEYTAFFAREGTDLSDWNAMRRVVNRQLDDRALKTRSGSAAVNQSLNLARQKKLTKLNYRNTLVDSALSTVQFSNVQQIRDRAFVNSRGRWVDARLIGKRSAATVDSEIEFGSPEHDRLLRRLVNEGRQAALSLPGEILLEVDGKTTLIKNPTETQGATRGVAR